MDVYWASLWIVVQDVRILLSTSLVLHFWAWKAKLEFMPHLWVFACPSHCLCLILVRKERFSILSPRPYLAVFGAEESIRVGVWTSHNHPVQRRSDGERKFERRSDHKANASKISWKARNRKSCSKMRAMQVEEDHLHLSSCASTLAIQIIYLCSEVYGGSQNVLSQL